MSRATYVLRNGELVDKRFAPPLHRASDAPMIRTDGMDPIVSMADGQIYDSKSSYYRSVRSAGCEIVGNDPAASRPHHTPDLPGHVERDVKSAMDMLNGRR